MFRHAFISNHCLVLADGYYEWRTERGNKRPYRFVLRNRAPFAMAGIWEPADHDDEPPTFSILTTTANELAAAVHDRMPVILPMNYEQRWLTETGYGAHLNLPLAYPAGAMECYSVTP